MKTCLHIRPLHRLGFLLTALLFSVSATLAAGPLDSALGDRLKNVDAAADSYEYIGSNLIANGHVVIRTRDIMLTANKAVINLDSEEIELVGDVTFAMQETLPQTLSIKAYEALLRDPFARTELLQYVTNPTGEQSVSVKVTRNKAFLKAERAAGNLRSGALLFKNFALKSGFLYCTGQYAERIFDGNITVRNAKFTTCEYLMDDHDHYAIAAKKAVISPRQSRSGVYNYNVDQGEHSVWAVNSFLHLWGVPVFWFPVLYKPRDWSSFGGRIEFGNSSEWGYYVRASKNFELMEEPYLNTNLMLDFYSERGIGYGIGADFLTPDSSTEAMFYGIRDREPYNYWDTSSHGKQNKEWARNHLRLDIPFYRYEFRLANLTHLAPRLDFRGQFDLISDFNFLDDFFSQRYDSELEPPTYASLEYQADRFTASLYATVRVNSFFSTVERLPEIRFDFQRQELFSNLYYQGETSFAPLNMRWRTFDKPRANPALGDPNDYNTLRFDTLHMFYYPMKFFNINFIPRTGFRLTAYSRSSKNPVDYNDLSAYFSANDMDGESSAKINPYDGRGGSKVRFTGEIGVEANTKFYRSWQEVKNAYWELDGLRHVAVPYVNYTFIPDTNVSKDHLFYFDDIDQIAEQNFVRLGLVNRLQTRRNNQIYEWISLENYWDYYFHREDGFNSIGDLGTIFRFMPFAGLSFTSELLLDLGGNNNHNYHVIRNGRDVGRPGLGGNFINRWYNEISWQFAPDWRVFGSYLYSDRYIQRNPYSMGGMFSAINATSMFITDFNRSQQLAGGLEFPLIFDKHLKGRVAFRYDVDAALMSDISFALTRRFHCWDLMVETGRTSERGGGDDPGKTHSYYFSVFVSLSAMPGLGFGSKMD